MGPQLYLILALVAALPVTYGTMAVKRNWEVRAAYDRGFEAGKGTASASAVEGATRTAAAERQAEIEVKPVDPRREAIIARCKRSASCRERGQLQ